MTAKGCVVITGGAGALGGAVLRRLLAQGQPCVALDTPRAEETLTALADQHPGTLLGIAMDVGSGEAWKEALLRAEERFGVIRGAVLCAGGWQGGRPVHEQADDSAAAAMMQRNFFTVHASLRAILPGMVARRQGSVVLVGSRAVERPWSSAGAAEYGASKAAVVTLAQSVAQEVLEHGVRINAVLPSTIDTLANRAAMPDADPSRWVSTDSLAAVVSFLLSEDARDISGAALPVYGRA
ncbi:MAG: SDR family NAD(P)-dependent oxidoreductase [Polyangiaceae bacterium]|jgi:NAD(P)-dependent dehydrogenase (short-subunit alcohol dehydrogenase family)|nr:SDR family NAD(P)-dependent oxidoreductase [Polyangiaceae bacterium]